MWSKQGKRGESFIVAECNRYFKDYFQTQMDLEIVMLSKVSQTEKDKYQMISPIGGI